MPYFRHCDLCKQECKWGLEYYHHSYNGDFKVLCCDCNDKKIKNGGKIGESNLSISFIPLN